MIDCGMKMFVALAAVVTLAHFGTGAKAPLTLLQQLQQEIDKLAQSHQATFITSVELSPQESIHGGPISAKVETVGEKFAKGGSEKADLGFEHSQGHINHQKGSHTEATKAGFHKNGGKKFNDLGHKSNYHNKDDVGSSGHKGHNFKRKGHLNKGKDSKGFKNIWHKEESGRQKKFFDHSENLKYNSDHDHLRVYHNAKKKGGFVGGLNENSHLHDLHGKKKMKYDKGSFEKVRENEKSYGHRKDYGEKTNHHDQGAHNEIYQKATGNPRIVHGGQHQGSHSSLHPTRVVIKNRNRNQNLNQNKNQNKHQNKNQNKNQNQNQNQTQKDVRSEEDVQGAYSSTVPLATVLKKDKFGKKLKTLPKKRLSYKKRPSQRRASKKKVSIPIKKLKTADKKKKLLIRRKKAKKILSKAKQTPSSRLNEDAKTKSLKINKVKKTSMLKKKPKNLSPLSLYVSKKALKDIISLKKNPKIKQKIYKKYSKKPEKNSKKSEKQSLIRKNEIDHEETRTKETKSKKPKLVKDPFITTFSKESSKQMKRVRKPLVVAPTQEVHETPKKAPAEPLEKLRSQQVSVRSNKKLRPSSSLSSSSSSKGGKPLKYKQFKAHEKGHHQHTREKVEKGGSQKSGYKGSKERHHGKHHDSKYVDKEKKKMKGHQYKDHYDGQYDVGKKASKGHARGNKGHQHKGHSDKGFKNVHHKLEYSVKKNFYHDDEDKAKHKVFDDFDKFFDKKKKENLEAHNNYGMNYGQVYGKKETNFDDYFDHFSKGNKGSYGNMDHHNSYYNQGHMLHKNGKNMHHHVHHGVPVYGYSSY